MTSGQIFRFMLYMDALGVSMFAIQATQKVMDMNFGVPLAPILLGIITAIGGGLIRDVLAGNTTLLMRRELYAVPITIGCVAYVVLAVLFPGSMIVIGVRMWRNFSLNQISPLTFMIALREMYPATRGKATYIPMESTNASQGTGSRPTPSKNPPSTP